MVRSVLQRIGAAQASAGRPDGTGHNPLAAQRTRRLRAPAIAAFLAIVLVAIVLRVHAHPTTQTLSRTFSTPAGQLATITLAGGTRVTLAPRSVLRVEAYRGDVVPSVSLDGEAFFDVPAHHSVPFVVRTGALTTRVLGTAFTVRRYGAERSVHVLVASGKVMVAAKASSVTLTAGRLGIVSDSTATVTTVGDVTPYTSWVSGTLVFERATASEVLSRVGHWYGYQFQLSDSTLANRHLSASFDRQSLADVLDALKTALNVSMTFNDTVITLHARQGPSLRGMPLRTRPNHENSDVLSSREVGR